MYVFTSNAFESLARMAFFSAAIYGTVLLVIAFATSLLLRRSSAALRHRLWSVTFLALLLLPLLSMSLPALPVPIDVEPALRHSDAMFGPSVRKQVVRFVDDKTQSALRPVEKPVTTSSTPNSQGTPSETLASSSWRFPELSFVQFAAITWAFVAAILLAGIVYGARQTRCYARRSRPITDGDVCRQFDDLCRQLKVNRPVRLLESTENVMPMTWGILHPAVLLPTEARMWSPDLRRAVLLHELFHVQRNDVAVQLLGRVVCALYWFHPLAWVALQKLRVEREQACDDAVLCAGERASDYASRLLEISRRCTLPTRLSLAIGWSNGGKLESRIRVLLDVSRTHAPLSRRGAFATVSLVMLIALVFAVVRPMILAAPPRVLSNPDNKVILMSGPLEHRVKVVDAAGEPVEGATLFHVGLRTRSGDYILWDKEWQPYFHTDKKGIARIAAPDVSEFGGIDDGGIVSLSFKVRHPEHPVVRVEHTLDNSENVVLEDTVSVSIRAIQSGTSQQLLSDLYLQSSSYEYVKCEMIDGRLTTKSLSAHEFIGGRFLRIVHAPRGQPASYSDLIDLQNHAKEGVAEFDVALYPGVRVEGQLPDYVPRPVKKGSVGIRIFDGPRQDEWPIQERSPQRDVWQWNDITSISADGSFVFESLPRNTNLQLIARCNGWVSQSTSVDDISAFAERHDSSLLMNFGGPYTRVTPQLVRLNEDVAEVVMPMEPTAECIVTVEEESGSTLDGMEIMIAANEAWYRGGTTFLGAWSSQLERLKNVDENMNLTQYEEFHRQRNLASHFIGMSDLNGQVHIRNLPEGHLHFGLLTEGYEIVSDDESTPASESAEVDVSAKQPTHITIVVRQKKRDSTPEED